MYPEMVEIKSVKFSRIREQKQKRRNYNGNAKSKTKIKTNDDAADKKEGQKARHKLRQDEKSRNYTQHSAGRGFFALFRHLERPMHEYRLLLFQGLS